ncbi:MAG: hypothetical protein LBJ90_08660 [Treponema sp.]|jgi:hypothetical protein|nr:hypothetical protein [Treponema sp.]
MTPSFVFSALSLALCGLFFIYFRQYLKRRSSAERLLGEYRNEVLKLIADIDAATDRDSLLIEERIKVLKSLLEDTDRRISVYVRELDRRRSGTALYTNLGRSAKTGGAVPGDPAAAPVKDAAPPGESVPAVPPPAILPAAPGGVPAAKDSAGKKTLREKITALAAQNLSPADIASRLKISLSEVDLALNLLGRGGRQ